ncbi:hypothetical protein GJ744_012060 [Endocarpon pusillum]|uniref:DUF7029 domain-containing protein n=1 Tax=Endocarpon pusillum TaxID=364733 RepID=A0A8H7AEC6_9EURO|nr:hypothetical protein GJ744_012060 [Endocarpon pusillum]
MFFPVGKSVLGVCEVTSVRSRAECLRTIQSKVQFARRLGQSFPRHYASPTGNIRITIISAFGHCIARSIDTALRHDHELHYVDDSDARRASSFAAQVRLSSKLPTLLLEELEHHTETIQCHDSGVTLSFPSLETVKLAHGEFIKTKNFYLITSHEGCNNDGERDVHLVSNVSLNEDIKAIVLSATRMPWENIFHKMDVRFGHSAETFEVRRHEDLRARQEGTTEGATSTSVTASATSNSITFPPAPTSTPGTFNVSGSVSTELIDAQIFPPTNGLEALLPLTPEIVQSLTVKCKSCSFQGTISLIQGFFSVENTRESADNDIMIHDFFFVDGYLKLQADNFTAHIELETSVKPSAALATMDIAFSPIGLPGFSIVGIVTVGPMFKPVINMGAQLSAEIDFTYGFDLKVRFTFPIPINSFHRAIQKNVHNTLNLRLTHLSKQIPNNSTITLNVAELPNSTETGFGEASLTPLPFQASIPSASLTLTAGFLPHLLLGISVGSGFIISGSAGVGAVFGLPKLIAQISQVMDVNERCEAVNTTTTDDHHDAFDSFTLIEPSLVLDVALVSEGDIKVAGEQWAINGQWPLYNKTFALPTACLSYDADASSYAPPAVAATAGNRDAGEGSSGQGSSGGVRLTVGTWEVLAWLLVGVMAVFDAM